MADFSQYIRPGKGRADLTLLFRDREAFAVAARIMADPFRASDVDLVAAIDALGFIFAAAVARELGVGMALIRKEGKVPVEVERVLFVDYSNTEKAFELARGAVRPDERVLIVDEWSETGSQLRAAATLVRKVAGIVVGISCFNIDPPVRADPELSRYRLHSVLVGSQRSGGW